MIVLFLAFAAPASALVAASLGPGGLSPEAHAIAAAQDAEHGHVHAIDDAADPLPAHTHDHNPADHFHEAADPAAPAAARLPAATGRLDVPPDIRSTPGPRLALERPPRI